MLFNFLMLLVILLLTAYFATQGLLSALLTFVTAAFASILALGLFEPMQGILEAYRPGFARGITFLVLYVAIFLGLRFASDYAVPKNIKLAKIMDTVGGGVLGFFAAMVVVGSCVLGLEMLPVPTAIMFGGDQEYPSETRMQGGELGQVASDDGMGTWPQRFVLTLFNGVSGRSLGGDKSFVAVHPDLVLESYGYRNVVQYGSNPALVQDLLKLDGAYISEEPDLLNKCGIAAGSGQVAGVVRIEVSRGGTSPKISYDATDSLFRFTPTQIRLRTDKGQRYPIGHLDLGTKFEPTPYDTGHIIDDYVHDTVVEDLVFQLDKDEKPQFLEVKQLARVSLGGRMTLATAFSPLAAPAYPERSWRKDAGSILVTVNGESGPLVGVKIFLVSNSVPLKGAISSAITAAGKHIEDVQAAANDNTEPWASALGKPGVPSRNEFDNAHRTIVQVQTQENMTWNNVVPVMMVGNAASSGSDNHTNERVFFHEKVEPLFSSTSTLRLTAPTGADGKALLQGVAPGEYCLVAQTKTEAGGYYLWTQPVKVEKKAQAVAGLKPESTSFKLTPVK
jgi:hypothetical protein